MPSKTQSTPRPTASPIPASDPLRPLGHVASAVLALGLAIAGLLAAGADAQALLIITLFSLAGITGLLTWQSWRGSRAAWAFLITIHGALTVYMLFGAPKIRDMGHVNITLALVPSALHLIVTVILALCAHAYQEREPRQEREPKRGRA